MRHPRESARERRERYRPVRPLGMLGCLLAVCVITYSIAGREDRTATYYAVVVTGYTATYAIFLRCAWLMWKIRRK